MRLKKIMIECTLENGKDDILEIESINDEWVLRGCYPERFIYKSVSIGECINFMSSRSGLKLFKNRVWNYCFEKGN